MKALGGLLRGYPAEAMAFLFSCLWRAQSIFVRSPMDANLYSDASFYFDLAKLRSTPGFPDNPGFYTHPPGAVWLALAFGVPEGHWVPIKILFLCLSIAIPLLLAFTASRIFDRTAARFCFWAGILYPPFWQYGSFLISELPLCFLITLATWLASLLFFSRVSGRRAGIVSALLGAAAGSALAFKITPLPGVLLFLACLGWARFRGQLAPGLGRRLAPALVVFMMILTGLSIRGTLGTGKFNFGTNKFPGDFLIGNHGRAGLFEFRGGGGTWGSPTSGLRGWNSMHSVPYAMWDSEGFREGLQWILQNPGEWLAMNHVKASAFLFDPPWPMFGNESYWVESFISNLWMSAGAYSLVVIALFLAWSERRRGSVLFLRETLLLLPVLGLLAALLMTSAEARYRAPFDALILLVAGAGFSRLRKMSRSASA